MASLLDDGSLWRLDTFRLPAGCLSGSEVVVDGPEGHHAVHVLRVRLGSLVRVIDGEGVEAIGRITRVASASAHVEIVESRSHTRSEGASLTIAQGLLKDRGFDEVVRRCTELGVAEIVPLLTARVQVRRRPAGPRAERWRAVAAAALKQSRGVFEPRILDPMPLEGLIERLPTEARTYVAWEEERSVSLRDALRADGAPRPVVGVVGPEGGLEQAEVQALERAGARPVSLGRRVLRADWAAAALAAAIAHETGGLLP
jgi:16S rRNA (uracil1498-N3)-methyltransferase